jgi:flagellar P-ring protein precursor FlgI
VAQAINARMGEGTAQALDGRTVQVRAPNDPNARVNFIAELEELPIETMVPAAKVVINARTGSIVLNQAVTLGPCAIAHGNLSITISSHPVISQPAPFSQGQTVVAQKATSRSSRSPARSSTCQLRRSCPTWCARSTAGRHAAGPAGHPAGHQGAGALNAELEVI